MFDFSYERTLRSVNESLSRLGLKYVDIIQVHDLEFAPSIEVVLTQTLPALQRIKAEGKARYIGRLTHPFVDQCRYMRYISVKIVTGAWSRQCQNC